MPMVEWRLDSEHCRHLTVVGLYDTGPWSVQLVEAVWLVEVWVLQVVILVPLVSLLVAKEQFKATQAW